MPDTLMLPGTSLGARIFRGAALALILTASAQLIAQPQTPAPQTPASVPAVQAPEAPPPAVTSGFLDEQAREAANKQQADVARRQLEANLANQQSVAAAEKARAENAQAVLAYEAEKARVASEYEAKLAAWNAVVAACKKNKKKVCVQLGGSAPVSSGRPAPVAPSADRASPAR